MVSYIILTGCWCDDIVLNVHAPSEEKRDDSKDSFYGELEQVFENFPMYLMKILFEDFNAKVGRENIFELTIGNESLHQDNNDNGAGIVNFAKSKNLVVKSTMFPHWNIHKFAWTSPDGKTHNHIAHILIDRRWHSSILDVQSFRGADCDTDHFLVVAEVRERLAVSKQAAQKIDEDRFNHRELEVRKQYQIEISDRISAVEDLSGRKEINRAWENVKKSIKTSAKVSLGVHKLQRHKPCFD